MSKAILGVCILLIATSAYGGVSTVDSIVEEARLKTEDGDLEAAAGLYHKALQQDSENPEIRRELANVLVEANVREPHTESVEAISAIEENRNP